MKLKLTLFAFCSLIALACAPKQASVEIIPIQDNVQPRVMARGLFADAPYCPDSEENGGTPALAVGVGNRHAVCGVR